MHDGKSPGAPGDFFCPKPLPMLKKEFSLEGSKQRPMPADIHCPEKPSSLVVIYVHGLNGYKDWGGMDLVAQSFAAAGMAFLKFNFSHNGTTPESPRQFVDLEAYAADRYLLRQEDLHRCVAYAQNTLNYEQIVLLGHSRGGVDALLYCAKASPAVRALITWSAPSHAQSPWRLFSESEMQNWRQSGRHYLINSRTQQKLPLDYGLYEEYQSQRQFLQPEKCARKLERPWLIVHGEEDETVFVKEAYDYKTWQSEAAVFIVAEGDHCLGRREPWTENQLPPPTQQAVEHSIAFIADCCKD